MPELAGSKKVILVVLLAAVIGGALWFALSRSVLRRGATPPARYLALPVAKIDEKTLQVITKTLGEWQKIGQRNGRYRNPETGEYTMLDVTVCQYCGGKIPIPPQTHVAPQSSGGNGSPEIPVETQQIVRCPLCGKMTEIGLPISPAAAGNPKPTGHAPHAGSQVLADQPCNHLRLEKPRR